MDDALISVLRQLRDGYPRRPQNFPHAHALIDMRDVRDYKVTSGGKTRLQTASPFTIKVESFLTSSRDYHRLPSEPRRKQHSLTITGT